MHCKLICNFLAKRYIKQFWQPPILFRHGWLFLKLKTPSKGNGRRFEDVEDIEMHVAKQLMKIPQNAFEKCFQQWKHHWENYVTSETANFD